MFFFFNYPTTTEIYTLSLHDALPICVRLRPQLQDVDALGIETVRRNLPQNAAVLETAGKPRSEEHTSELQSHVNLVCRLLLEKKKKKIYTHTHKDTNNIYTQKKIQKP